jgi:hypothetical protein
MLSGRQRRGFTGMWIKSSAGNLFRMVAKTEDEVEKILVKDEREARGSKKYFLVSLYKRLMSCLH